MTNILFTLIVATTIKVVSVTLAPKYYLITYEDGQRQEVIMSENNDTCPSYCQAEHAHKVSMCDGECENISKNFMIQKQINANETFNLYCNGKAIMLFEEIQKDTPKNKNKPPSMNLF